MKPSSRTDRRGYKITIENLHDKPVTYAILDRLPPVAKYSITDAYLDLIEDGADLRGLRVDGAKWRDCGRPPARGDGWIQLKMSALLARPRSPTRFRSWEN